MYHKCLSKFMFHCFYQRKQELLENDEYLRSRFLFELMILLPE